jgi:Uma2 family endonuclease
MAAPHATLANPLAPWAEIVPNMPPMTTDELRAIPDDGWAYELVEGVLVRMPLSSFGASNIGSRLPNLTEKAHGFSRVDESAPFTRVSAPALCRPSSRGSDA